VQKYCPQISSALLSAPRLRRGDGDQVLLEHEGRSLQVTEGLSKNLLELMENKDTLYRQLAEDVVVPLSLGVQQCQFNVVR
jgi:hypothetical protein